MNINVFFALASVGFSAISAFLWYLACITRVKPNEESTDYVTNIIEDNGEVTDYFATSRKQLKLNTWAAIAMCIACVFQALSNIDF